MTPQQIPQPHDPSHYPLVDARRRREHTQQVTDILISGSKASVDLLLSQAWAKGFRDPDHNRTMLHIAARAGSAHSVQKLLAAGFDPNAIDNGGWTPLLLAARTFNEAAVDALLAAGANANVKDSASRTVLHHAGGVGGSSVLQRLLKTGVDMNHHDALGATALHLAAQAGHANNVVTLLDAGADFTLKDSRGFTAFRCALKSGHERPALMLASVGGASAADAAYAKTKSIAHIAIYTPFKCAVMLEGIGHLRRCLERFPEVDDKQLKWATKRYEQDDNGAEDQIALLTAHIAKRRIASIANLARKTSAQHVLGA